MGESSPVFFIIKTKKGDTNANGNYNIRHCLRGDGDRELFRGACVKQADNVPDQTARGKGGQA